MTRAELAKEASWIYEETFAPAWLAYKPNERMRQGLVAALEAALVSVHDAAVNACDAKLAERHNHHDRAAVRSLLIGGA